LEGLAKKDLRMILERIGTLGENPRPSGAEKLAGVELWRIRQGNYRIVYSIEDDTLTVWIVKVGHLIGYLLKNQKMTDVEEVIVITDTIPVRKKAKVIEKAVKTTLEHMLPEQVRYRVLHHASKSTFGLQVADYCNWAIFRKWEREDTRSYELIRSRVLSEFDIFRTGRRNYYEPRKN